MKTDKKLTLKRLIIFCFLAFAPIIIATPILCKIMGGPIFEGENAATPLVSLYGMMGMCTPMMANFITRLITKEGVNDPYISFSFRNGKWKYYLASVLVPLGYSFISAILLVAIMLRGYAADEIFEFDKFSSAPFMIIFMLANNASLLLSFFGEEYGWRGYLGPKLTELMNEPAAIVVGGIIWGLWHAPLTCVGHNFGTDYPLFPFSGILMMCITCIILNAFLTLITNRTGSVMPASFAHMAHNSAGATIMLTYVMKEDAYHVFNQLDPIKLSLISYIPLTVTAIICFILLMKKNKAASEAAA